MSEVISYDLQKLFYTYPDFYEVMECIHEHYSLPNTPKPHDIKIHEIHVFLCDAKSIYPDVNFEKFIEYFYKDINICA